MVYRVDLIAQTLLFLFIVSLSVSFVFLPLVAFTFKFIMGDDATSLRITDIIGFVLFSREEERV